MEKPFAVFATRLGGPEVLEARPIAMPEARSDQVVIEHTAIGVNFVDIYLRSGQPHSHNPEPPFVPGVSAAGRVIAIGPQVEGLKIGDRAAYANAGVGSYCTHVAAPAERILKLPDSITDVRAAAGLLRGLTAQYLLQQIRPLKAGDRVLTGCDPRGRQARSKKSILDTVFMAGCLALSWQTSLRMKRCLPTTGWAAASIT
jgi:NADPH2:quinone reductase